MNMSAWERAGEEYSIMADLYQLDQIVQSDEV